MSQSYLDGLGPRTPLIDDGRYVLRGAKHSRMVRDKSRREIVSIGRMIASADAELVSAVEAALGPIADEDRGDLVCKIILEALK